MDLIYQLNAFMAGIGLDYALCGGHAIDLYLGKKTRPHKDLDVAVYREDRDKIIQYMLNENWDIYEPCGAGFLHKINDISSQKYVKDNIWCVKSYNQNYKFTEYEKDMYTVCFNNSEQTELDYIEFLFNTRADGNFLYRRNHNIKMSLENAILKINAVPCLAPEIVLLYKSTAPDNADYQLDFENALKKMNEEQSAWLKKALSIMFPCGHKWLEN